jgi:general secretion pathway protein M
MKRRASFALDLSALSERDRRLAIAGLIGAAALLIIGVILPLDRSVAQAHKRLSAKRADLAWMQGAAPEVASAGPVPSANGQSLPVMVDRTARESGLGGALHTEAAGSGSLSVRLEKASFDVMIGWLARLAQQQGVRVESATIEKADAPGLVNAAIVLHAG